MIFIVKEVMILWIYIIGFNLNIIFRYFYFHIYPFFILFE